MSQLVLGGQISMDNILDLCSSKDDLLAILAGRTGPDRRVNDARQFQHPGQPGQ